MPELTTSTEMRVRSQFAVAECMSRKIAILGGRLAHLLAQSPVAQEDVLTRAHTFLHAMYDAFAVVLASRLYEFARTFLLISFTRKRVNVPKFGNKSIFWQYAV